MTETSSSEPGPLRLLALVAPTLTLAYLAVLPVIFIISAVTPEAPLMTADAIVRPIIAPSASVPPVSRVKPLLAHLKRLHKPAKRRGRKRNHA